MFSRRIAIGLVAAAGFAFFQSTAAADYEVVNHSNEVVNVAVTHVGPNGRIETTGWKEIQPGEARIVHFGSEPEIGLSIRLGHSQTRKIPHQSTGTTMRLVHGRSECKSVTESGTGMTLLYWAGNMHSVGPNMPPPPGWHFEQFHIVKGNDATEVLP